MHPVPLPSSMRIPCPASARGAQVRQSAEQSAVNATEVYFMFVIPAGGVIEVSERVLVYCQETSREEKLTRSTVRCQRCDGLVLTRLMDVLGRSTRSHCTQVDYGQLP